jgi:GNAT superfamily N-acetyltransferase
MTYEIHSLSIHELHLCAPFGEAFHREMKLPGEFIGQKFVDSWISILSTIPSTILLLRHHHEVIGGLGGAITPDLNDGRLCAQELFWFVDPQHRGGSGSVRLVQAFEEWAVSKGAVEMRMVRLLTGGDTERLDGFYTKRGYGKLEMHYWKPLKKEEV